LRILVERELVTIHASMGAQVIPGEPVQRDMQDITKEVAGWRGFHVSAKANGHEPYTRTTVQHLVVDDSVARWLKVESGTEVLLRARLQGVEGQPPVQIANTYVRMEVVGRIPVLLEINTGPGGIYSRMADVGYSVRFEEHISCRLPDADEQRRLEIKRDQPVLVIWRRCYDREDEVLEVTNRIIVGSRHELTFRYA
jgi:GntR family transcriptional regulator